MSAPWTEERTTLAKSMWEEGFSASIIADKLGDITRNAVIGKVMRMGLQRRQGPVSFRLDGKTLRPAKTPKPKVARPPRGPKLKAEPIPEPPAVFTTEHFRTIGQLENEHCRFPCWEDGATIDQQFYCGTPTADVADGRAWCGYHSRIAFAPPRPRKAVKHWNTHGQQAAA